MNSRVAKILHAASGPIRRTKRDGSSYVRSEVGSYDDLKKMYSGLPKNKRHAFLKKLKTYIQQKVRPAKDKIIHQSRDKGSTA